MIKQKVISFEELKENFCLETMKQKFLDFGLAKNNLDNYLKSREERDLRHLFYSVMILCDSYFKKNVCTYDMWNVKSELYGDSLSLCLVYTIYTMNNNNLRKEDNIVAYLEQENGIYLFDFNEYIFCKERKIQRMHDMEVGRFMLQCYADLLNGLLQEVEK